MSERTCSVCERAEDHTLDPVSGKFAVELRPYGPGGADICFQCATATPEAEENAKRTYGTLLDAHDALPGVTTLSADGLGKVPDLMAALEESIAKAKTTRKGATDDR